MVAHPLLLTPCSQYVRIVHCHTEDIVHTVIANFAHVADVVGQVEAGAERSECTGESKHNNSLVVEHFARLDDVEPVVAISSANDGEVKIIRSKLPALQFSKPSGNPFVRLHHVHSCEVCVG